MRICDGCGSKLAPYEPRKKVDGAMLCRACQTRPGGGSVYARKTAQKVHTFHARVTDQRSGLQDERPPVDLCPRHIGILRDAIDRANESVSQKAVAEGRQPHEMSHVFGWRTSGDPKDGTCHGCVVDSVNDAFKSTAGRPRSKPRPEQISAHPFTPHPADSAQCVECNFPADNRHHQDVPYQTRLPGTLAAKVWWHGSPYGGPSKVPGENGVHVGTQQAAREALNARIGHRADGRDWDGTTEYGKTMLAGTKTLKDLGRYPTGYSSRREGFPEEDHLPKPEHQGGGLGAPMDAKPHLFPVHITGPMSNSESTPHSDYAANGRMKSLLQRGQARKGYYYENVGEDSGSISAVVPSWDHLTMADHKTASAGPDFEYEEALKGLHDHLMAEHREGRGGHPGDFADWAGKMDAVVPEHAPGTFEREWSDRMKHSSKDERFKGVSLKQDDDGWYVTTHRARSDSYPSPEEIPDSKIKFIESTGALSHLSKKKADEWEPPTVSGVALRAADTGRMLMIQRSLKDEKDPARGTWEFPGGHHEDGDKSSLHAGIREWEEEVGHPFPEDGAVTHTWRSGPYQGHVVTVPEESCVDFSEGRRTTNPDDPDNDDHEQSAWWDPEHAQKNPALRQEVKDSWKDLAPGLKHEASGDEDYRMSHRPAGGDYGEGSSFDDPSNVMPDVHDHPEWYDQGNHGRETIQQLRAAKGNPEHPVTIYRALPHGHTNIRTGDWVTPSAKYADQHAVEGDPHGDGSGDWPVIKATVPAKHLNSHGDIHEWGYNGPEIQAEIHHPGGKRAMLDTFLALSLRVASTPSGWPHQGDHPTDEDYEHYKARAAANPAPKVYPAKSVMTSSSREEGTSYKTVQHGDPDYDKKGAFHTPSPGDEFHGPYRVIQHPDTGKYHVVDNQNRVAQYGPRDGMEHQHNAEERRDYADARQSSKERAKGIADKIFNGGMDILDPGGTPESRQTERHMHSLNDLAHRYEGGTHHPLTPGRFGADDGEHKGDGEGQPYYEVKHPSGYTARDYGGDVIHIHHQATGEDAHDTVHVEGGTPGSFSTQGTKPPGFGHEDLHRELHSWVQENGQYAEHHDRRIPQWQRRKGYTGSRWMPTAADLADFEMNLRAAANAPFTAADDHDVLYHLTDKHHFSLDPEHSPHDNTFAIQDRSGRKGLYGVSDPYGINRWRHGEGYQRPYVAEIHVPKGTAHDERWAGEKFLPAEHFDKAKVHRVMPVEQHEQETYYPNGRTHERETGDIERHAGSPAPGEGKDVRDFTPEEHTEHLHRLRNYLHDVHGWGWNEFNDKHEHVGTDETNDDGEEVRRGRDGSVMTRSRYASRTASTRCPSCGGIELYAGEHEEHPEHHGTTRLHEEPTTGPNAFMDHGGTTFRSGIPQGLTTPSDIPQYPHLNTERFKMHPNNQGPDRPAQVNIDSLTDDFRPLRHSLNTLELDMNTRIALTTTAGQRLVVVAHDSGDGQTIYHCPFCGSGQVIARSDRTIECEFCHTSFTVQVQPQFSAFPQTIDGQPVDVPGMPGQIDSPMDPDALGDDGSGADFAGPPGPDNQPPWLQDDSQDQQPPMQQAAARTLPPWTAGQRTFSTASGAVLVEDQYVRHLAVVASGKAPEVLKQVKAAATS